MSDYISRLQELVDDFHTDAARLERQGRALSDAETRRVAALRYAADLVLRAGELLAADEGDLSMEPAGGQGAGSDVDTAGAAPSAGGWRGEVTGERASGMSGDDDTPGYDRIRGLD